MDFYSTSPIPDKVKFNLLCSCAGREHLSAAGFFLLQQAAASPGHGKEFLETGLSLNLAAYLENPFDPAMASWLAAASAGLNFCPKPVLEMARAMATHKSGEQEEAVKKLFAAKEFDQLWDLLDWILKNDPKNLYQRHLSLDLGFLLGKWEEVDAILDMDWPAPLLPAVLDFKGRARCMAKDFGTAMGLFQRAEKACPGISRLNLAHALDMAGEKQDAAKILIKEHRGNPWRHVSILKAYELLAGPDAAALPGRMAVLIYTFNKQEHIGPALQALFETMPENAMVFALDNGSTDNTPEVLDKYAQSHPDRMRLVRLPVNIGAPQARNWLLAEPDVMDHDFICFLDDDAILPHGWPEKMAKAVSRYPQAGVWGVKVADLEHGGRIQNVDIHLMTGEFSLDPPESFSAARTVAFNSAHSQNLDYGQFDYIRPCASVTGCFHMFRPGNLREGFDIRFSPTQYDDLDHDLGLVIEGKMPVYNGLVKVGHARKSGALLAQSPAQAAGSRGNLVKLCFKRQALFHEIINADFRAMLEDLNSKTQALSG